MTTRRIWPPEDPSRHEQPQPEAAVGPLTFDQKVINVIKQVYDPEIPVNIVDLGLIYKIDTQPCQTRPDATDVHVIMTLTTPNCPEAESIPLRVQQMIQKLPETGEVEVDIVWDPPWDQTKMSDDARLILGLD